MDKNELRNLSRQIYYGFKLLVGEYRDIKDEVIQKHGDIVAIMGGARGVGITSRHVVVHKLNGFYCVVDVTTYPDDSLYKAKTTKIYNSTRFLNLPPYESHLFTYVNDEELESKILSKTI